MKEQHEQVGVFFTGANSLPELPAYYNGTHTDLFSTFKSGIGDLNDLLVSLPMAEPREVDFEVIGKRLENTGVIRNYVPVAVDLDVWATANIPWNTHSQEFIYRVDIYPAKRFSYEVNVTIDLTELNYAWFTRITFKTLADEIVHVFDDEPTPAVISVNDPQPIQLFPETLDERAHAILTLEGYQQEDYELQSVEIIVSSKLVNVQVDENGYVYVSLTGTHFTGTYTKTDEVIYAYESPKTITDKIIHLFENLYNENGDPFVDDGVVPDFNGVIQVTVQSFDPEVILTFADNGQDTTDSINTFVQASYNYVLTGQPIQARVTYPNVLTATIPTVYEGDAHYKAIIVSNSVSVDGHFESPDGSIRSERINSPAGAITDNPAHHLKFYVTESYQGESPWQSTIRRIKGPINPSGQFEPFRTVVTAQALQVPDNAIKIQFHVKVAGARAMDGTTPPVQAYFEATGTTSSMVYENVPATNEGIVIFAESHLYTETQKAEQRTEVLYRGSGVVPADGETLLAEFMSSNGPWDSITFKANTEDVIGYAEQDGDVIRVRARLSTGESRWRPRINAGTYYHRQVEYVKFKDPVFFTIGPDQDKEIAYYGLARIMAVKNGAATVFGHVRVSDSNVKWLHRRPLIELVKILAESDDIEDVTVEQLNGQLKIDLDINGFLSIVDYTSIQPQGLFKQSAGGVTLPVELPISGPVIAWDTFNPGRTFIRLDSWAETDFVRTVELVGKGNPVLILPVPYATLISCEEDGKDITSEIDVLGAAAIRSSGLFEFGKVYRMTIMAREAFGVVGEGPNLRLKFSENAPSITVACERGDSYTASEQIKIPVVYTNPSTGSQYVEDWVPTSEPVTLFPFRNPIDSGFLIVSHEKHEPRHLRLLVGNMHLPARMAGMPLTIVAEVTDSIDNPVGGEVVRVWVPWLNDWRQERTDMYGFASIVVPAPYTSGTYVLQAYVRQIGAQVEVTIQ